MQTFRNINFVKRSIDCSNIVACRAVNAPAAHFEPCSDDILQGLELLEIRGTVEIYGYL